MEPPEERTHRHAMEGRLQFATVEALEELKAIVKATDKRVAEMYGWFMGVPRANGTLDGGVLQAFTVFRSLWRWVIGLLGAIATSSILNALHTYLPHIFRAL